MGSEKKSGNLDKFTTGNGIRIIADELAMARIFAVYDCYRVALKNFPGLVAGRGSGDVDGESMEENESEPNKYVHIQACGPGGIADADGGFAERLLKTC